MSILLYHDCPIEQRQDDGYVNGTAMCKANRVLIGHWLCLKQTKAYIVQLSIEIGIPILKLTETRKGGDSSKQGTWLHPLLALNLGRWISPKFAIWCDRHIKVLIETGQTAIAESTESIPSDSDRLTKIELTLEELTNLVHEQVAIAALSKPKTSKQRMQELLLELKGGLTVTQFSQAIKIDAHSLRRYLNGYSEPSLPRYFAIAHYMEVSIDDLFARIFP
jgi:hypothetical protein